MTDNRPLLKLQDVADRLNVSRSMAWKLVNSGRIRSVRIGRALRVMPAELEEFIKWSDPSYQDFLSEPDR